MFQRLLLLVVCTVSIQLRAEEYLVKYSPQTYAKILSLHGFVIEDSNEMASLLKINIPKTNLVWVFEQLYRQAEVEYIVPNARLHSFMLPVKSEPILRTKQLKEQWHLAKVNIEQAWAKVAQRGSKGVTVAVIDTGVDYNHLSLKENMLPGYDFYQNDEDPMDITGTYNPGHGTHCAGIIGATGLIEGGTIGISPEVSILPIRFLGADGGGDLNNGIKAIDFAIAKKVDIISASWGAAISRADAQPLLEAIQRAEKAGIIFVTAAANDGQNNDQTEIYPANAGFDNVITVAASGSNDEKPYWSNYGLASVHLAAPGLDIMSTIPNSKYDLMSGTSMATPLVAGLVALLKAQDPTLSASQVRAILQRSGRTVNIQTQCECRVDALAATEMVMGKKLYMTPMAGTYSLGSDFQLEVFNGQGPVSFQSTNESVLTVSAEGKVTAKGAGDAVIKVIDTSGNQVESKIFHVKDSSSTKPDDPNKGGNGQCPIKDPKTCEDLCLVMPESPWCKR